MKWVIILINRNGMREEKTDGTMMDALVRYGREPEAYAIREMPIPVIGPDEVLVEVAYAGICGTDAVTFRNEDHGFVDPLIQGHELSGIIVAVGDHVVGWSLGDRVAPESSARLCGTCPMCLTGRRYLCPEQQCFSYGIHGVFARYAKCHGRTSVCALRGYHHKR